VFVKIVWIAQYLASCMEELWRTVRRILRGKRRMARSPESSREVEIPK
jgi:hypothetical protein